MRKIITMMALCALGACSGASVSYEQAIEECARSTIRGIKDSYTFKVLDIAKTGEITVGDSIAIMDSDFGVDKASKLEQARVYLTALESLSASQQSNRFTPEDEKQQMVAKIEGQQRVIDSLDNTVPAATYSGRNMDEVLVHVVRCNFELGEPSSGRTLAETYDFFLSPDGKHCYGKSRSR